MENQNHYFTLYLNEETEGIWNIIQVIDNAARYFLLRGDINSQEDCEKAKKMPYLSHGYVEDGCFFDGDESPTVHLNNWERHEGTLFPF